MIEIEWRGRLVLRVDMINVFLGLAPLSDGMGGVG